METNKQHWDSIYEGKKLQEMSWYEPFPETSLAFINKFSLSKTAGIIDIGGGDSFLADNLLKLGYENITVLDISSKSLEKAKRQLGGNADKIKWIESDILDFQPTEKYDLWHDRATFHFLTDAVDQQQYLEIANQAIAAGGYLLMGAFSANGPGKCSGLKVKQYSERSMTDLLQQFFTRIKCITREHITPFNTIQQFIFCSFKKLIFS